MLKYSLWRLVLFLACFGLAWAVLWLTSPDRTVSQDRMLYALLIGAFGSMALSWFLLKGMRQQLSDRINERVAARMADRAGDHRGEDELAEDEFDDDWAQDGPAGEPDRR